jgi:hypothetical protein
MLMPEIRGGAWRLRWGVAALAVMVPLAIPSTALASNSANAESLQYVSISVAPVTGSDQEYDAQASASPTANGQTVFSLTFKAPLSSSSVITADNNATASTDCENCEAVAISFQAVVAAKQDLAELTANDVSNATTNSCGTCNALAEAFQIVYAPYGSNPMSWMIIAAFAQLKSELQGLDNSRLSVDQIQTESTQDVNYIVSELQDVSGGGPSMAPAINDYDLPLATSNQPYIHLLSTYQF